MQIKQQPNKKSPELSVFTVMISRGLGKVRSFSFSSRFLLWASIIFVLYIIGSAMGTCLYLGELGDDMDQSERVKQLANETEETRRELYQARQRLKLLEDTLHTLQGKEKKEVGAPKTEDSHGASTVSEEKVQNGPEGEASPEPLVTIQRLRVKRNGERFSVNFRLARTTPDGSQLSGHLFIIAANTASNPHRFWTYPKVDLKDGVPVDHALGLAFKVRNYRIIQRSLLIGSGTESPPLLSILAYDTTGNLILDEAFAMDETL